MKEIIIGQLKDILKGIGIGQGEFSVPPKPEMGDFAFPVFQIAKSQGKNPAEFAKEIAERITPQGMVEKVQAFGPYVNFFLNAQELAKLILEEIKTRGNNYGTHQIGTGKKYLVEFACPNPLKAFHLGHLKNLITGESVVRVFENAGYEVVRVNYQGDVGMHVAKALWGIIDWTEQFEAVKNLPLKVRVEFLGKAYAHGANHFEESDAAKEEVVKYNDIVYENSDENVMKVYAEARAWSLEYFDEIYHRLGSHFDRLYFESEMFQRGVEIINEGLTKGIFAKSEGAVIFEGSKHGLHDRVFINSKGFPTYEAKDLALAERHFDDHHPDKVVHVVGKEQTQYFEVLIKALEFVLPESVGKEYHLVGGFLQLKGNQKMSSRKGNIVTGDELLQGVLEQVQEIMESGDKKGATLTPDLVEKVAVAALKYGMLKSDVSQDVAFDLEESVSVAGESGPYLLYIVARIKSILRKADVVSTYSIPETIMAEEKQLLLKVSEFPEVTRHAVESYDPSKISKYLFELAQNFNTFYHACPVLQEEGDIRNFRVGLIGCVLTVMERGLYLLGIETVEEM